MFLKDGFAVTRNHLYQTLPTLFKQWIVTLDIMPIGLVKNVYSNILHMGTGGEKENYGDRTPAIYCFRNQTTLRIVSAINGVTSYPFISSPLPMHKWTRVEVSQLRQSNGSYQFTIQIADNIIAQVENTDAREFSNVKVFASNNYTSAARAKIRNIKISSFPDNWWQPVASIKQLDTTQTSSTTLSYISQNVIPNGLTTLLTTIPIAPTTTLKPITNTNSMTLTMDSEQFDLDDGGDGSDEGQGDDSESDGCDGSIQSSTSNSYHVISILKFEFRLNIKNRGWSNYNICRKSGKDVFLRS